MRVKGKKIASKLFLILTGGMIQGLAIGEFLFPHSIPSGGAGGLTVLFNYLFHIPMGTVLWFVNASMLLLAVHYLGGANAIGTLIGITVTSITVNFIEVNMNKPVTNVWFDFIVGSLLLGTGVAILLRQGVSNGGIGVIALILAKKKGIDPGKTLFWVNGSIFLITAYIIDWKIVIEAIISQWLSTRVVNWLYRLPIHKPFILTFAWRKK